MATYVKLRGLGRASATADAGVMKRAGRGVRVRLPFQQAEGGSGVVSASLSIANQIKVTANAGGAWGNNVTFATAVGGASPSVAVTYPSAGSPNPTITVTAPATATLAANQAIVAAINSDPTAAQYVTAAINGTGAAANGTTSAALSSGSDGSNSTLYPIHGVVSESATVVVDVDNPYVARALRRNPKGWISLGAQ